MNTLVDSPAPPTTEAQTIEKLLQSVSPSKLALFQSCRLKFFFRHVLRLKKPKSAALHVGAVVHGALKAWNRARWRQQPLSSASLYAAYEETWNLGQPLQPLRCHDGGSRLLIIMPVRVEGNTPVVGAQTPAAASSEAKPDQTPTNPPPSEERNQPPMQNIPTNHNNNGNAQPSAVVSESAQQPWEKPSLEQALEQIESIKVTIRSTVANLNNLADTLRQVQRERRLNEREIRSVRDTLKSLQTVRL